MSLTDTAIRNARAKEKPYKMSDDRGLYLLVNKAGKYFRYDYRFQGKRKTLAIGVYPDVTLKVARGKHQAARRLLQNDAVGCGQSFQHRIESQFSPAVLQP